MKIVFVASASDQPKASDDALEVGFFDRRHLPDPLAFDHARILQDYIQRCSSKK